VVTNAGANHLSVYEPMKRGSKLRWSAAPVVRGSFAPEEIFQDVNGCNKQEGGAKGIAIHQDSIAVCSPEDGIKIYQFRENMP
jgi:hypothetical protein